MFLGHGHLVTFFQAPFLVCNTLKKTTGNILFRPRPMRYCCVRPFFLLAVSFFFKFLGVISIISFFLFFTLGKLAPITVKIRFVSSEAIPPAVIRIAFFLEKVTLSVVKISPKFPCCAPICARRFRRGVCEDFADAPCRVCPSLSYFSATLIFEKHPWVLAQIAPGSVTTWIF